MIRMHFVLRGLIYSWALRFSAACIALLGLLLIVFADLNVRADQTSVNPLPVIIPDKPWLTETSSPVQIVPDKIRQADRLITGNTNYLQSVNLDPAILKSNSIAPNDVAGVWLLGEIENIKSKLQNQALDPTARKFMENNLADLQVRLDDHKNQVQGREAFIARVRANPRTAMTNFSNLPDPVVQSMSALKARYERTLAETNLAPEVRKADEHLLATIDQHLTDHQTNVQLWANLHQVEMSKDPAKTEQAKRALASYLAIRLGKIQGKTYPANISLDAIMVEYNKLDGGSSWFRSRNIIRAAIIGVFLVPPVVMMFMMFRKRIGK